MSNIYRQALLAQDACNLSGLARDFPEMIRQIWEEAYMNKGGTIYVNHHPVVVLMLEKMCDLADYEPPPGSEGRPWNRYCESFDECKRRAEALEKKGIFSDE